MKFPRNARMIRSQLDVAPFAGVFFCLLIFVLLCSLVYTPGVLIKLPESATPWPGVEGPKIYVGMDPNGNFYYDRQIIRETNLVRMLKTEAARQSGALTLVIAADRGVTTEQWIHLTDLASTAGIRNIQQQVLPPLFGAPGGKHP